MLIFVRTKTGAAELAEQLQARGYAAEAMHGDMNQAQRERVVAPPARRPGRDPGGHRRGGARARRRAHQPRRQLRHPERRRGLRPPHRPHRPRRPRRHRDPLRHPARDAACCRRSSATPASASQPMKMPSAGRRRRAPARALFKERLRKAMAEDDLELVPGAGRGAGGGGGFDMAEIAAAAARAGARRPAAQRVELGARRPRRRPTEDGMVRLFIDAGRTRRRAPGGHRRRDRQRGRHCPARRSAPSTSTTASPSSRCRRSTADRCSSAW